ncbi:MAG: hypothetical protein LBK24_03310, partial [Puniceicoccales bacterium]|nr:hypothetical protein [Puniceicoccales bacterium]
MCFKEGIFMTNAVNLNASQAGTRGVAGSQEGNSDTKAADSKADEIVVQPGKGKVLADPVGLQGSSTRAARTANPAGPR